MITRKGLVPSWAAGIALLLMTLPALVRGVLADELDPRTLTKHIDPLPVPGAMPMAGPNYDEIGAWQIQQQLHSQLPPTTVYGYGATQASVSYPGATIVARKGVPISIPGAGPAHRAMGRSGRRWQARPVGHLLREAVDQRSLGLAQAARDALRNPTHGGCHGDQ